MKPGELYSVKIEFVAWENPEILVRRGEILLFLKRKITTDDEGKHRRYFFLRKDKIVSFSLGHDPVILWVKKYPLT